MDAVADKKPAFHVGDKVSLTFGIRRVQGRITEDRGPLGFAGRRIYGVRLDMDPYDPMFVERPEDDLKAATEPERPLSKTEIIDYLSNGGLMTLLINGSDGRMSPAWLCRDSEGGVTYTFAEDRGLVGGGVPPALAESDGRIFSPYVPKVADFLRSFDLSLDEARKVIDRVGTHP